MARRHVYSDWGFDAAKLGFLNGNPFDTSPLGRDSHSKALFVGRETERAMLSARIATPPKITIIEAPVGTGKTSLINQIDLGYLTQDLRDRQFLFCDSMPPLRNDEDVTEFERRVYLELASAIADEYRRSPIIERAFGQFSIPARLHRWIHRDSSRQTSLGAIGISLGAGAQPSQTPGFVDKGLRRLVDTWLTRNIDRDDFGGVICVLDNLDSAEATTGLVAAALDRNRDSLMVRQGLRWLLCGPPGLHNVCNTVERLQRFLNSPICLEPLSLKEAVTVFTRRLKHTTGDSEPYLPVRTEHFKLMYDLTGHSLGKTLSRVDEFCQWTSTEQLRPESDATKDAAFKRWASGLGDRVMAAASLSEREIVVLEKAAEGRGQVSLVELQQRLEEESLENVRRAAKDLSRRGVVNLKINAEGLPIAVQISFDGYFCIEALAEAGRWKGRTLGHKMASQSGV